MNINMISSLMGGGMCGNGAVQLGYIGCEVIWVRFAGFVFITDNSVVFVFIKLVTYCVDALIMQRYGDASGTKKFRSIENYLQL